jgi:hypothetical protein
MKAVGIGRRISGSGAGLQLYVPFLAASRGCSERRRVGHGISGMIVAVSPPLDLTAAASTARERPRP